MIFLRSKASLRLVLAVTWCSKSAGYGTANDVSFLDAIQNDSSGCFTHLTYSNGFFMSCICVGDKEIGTKSRKGK